jgi:nucleoside-diphosphate-sugar epimerase
MIPSTSEAQSSKRFLVTGGAGFLGINLCRYLLARGHTVRTLDIAPFTYPERNRIEVVDGDIRDADCVERAMAGVDIVVHCAAALPLAPAEDILSTAVRGTRLLLESAATHRVSRFIFTSSTAVYGIPDHHPLVETDPLRGVGPYGESKIQAETLCRSGEWNGLCVSILRPKSFVGPERLGAFELLYDWAYSGHGFPVLGSGNNLYQLLDVDDLCRAIELCTLQPASARCARTFRPCSTGQGTGAESLRFRGPRRLPCCGSSRRCTFPRSIAGSTKRRPKKVLCRSRKFGSASVSSPGTRTAMRSFATMTGTWRTERRRVSPPE